MPLRECPRLKSSLTYPSFTTGLHLLRFTAVLPLLQSGHMVHTSPNSLAITKSDLRHVSDYTVSPLYYSSNDCHCFLLGRSRIPTCAAHCALLACLGLQEKSGSVESTTVVSPSFSYHDVLRWRWHWTQLEDSLTDGDNMMLAFSTHSTYGTR